MKMPKISPMRSKSPGARNSLRGGAYSIAITAVVLATLIAVNILVSALPVSLTKYDISASQLYSVTSNTKAVVNGLDEDVTIYWIVQSDQEDSIIENLLNKYDSLSDHIQIVKKNPDVYPTFAGQYTSETAYNNSLVVECGSRSRFISLSDIYPSQLDMYTASYSVDEFDGEGAITSAIDYVTRETLPQLYVLEGHGEAELPETFAQQLEKENVEVTSLSLLTTDAIPEDAGCVMIYGPESDLSEQEAELLSDYVSSGGKLLVCAGPAEDDSLETLYSLIAGYGVEPAEGIAVEQDSQYYSAFGGPLMLIPDMNSHAVTDALIADNYYIMMPIAQGLTVSDSAQDTVTSLLSTSDTSFSKTAGYDLSTYEKEDGDIDGPFSLAVSISCENDGQIIWFSSSAYLSDTYNAMSSGANGDLTMNAVAALIGESESMAIRSKSLSYHYLNINEAVSSMLQAIMIGVIPLLYLGLGIFVVIKRRHDQNVPV